jgi:MoxR-like ATPase
MTSASRDLRVARPEPIRHIVTHAKSPCPASIDETADLLAGARYIADRALATVIFLSLRMRRPLFLEGEAGVGKTEIAKVLAQALGRKLIRLQCYEGLDVATAVYEWNYSRQMVEIRLAEAEGVHDRERLADDIYDFALPHPPAAAAGARAQRQRRARPADRRARPHRRGLRGLPARSLSDFQITIPELGTVKAAEPPIVIITSNRTREVHDA